MIRKGKETMVEAEGVKFKWDHDSTKIFLDMLHDWKKKNVGLLKWDKISMEFKRVSGFNCTPHKLKTKHDNMKANWQLFNRLMNSETGLGFNSLTGKVEASDDWWEARIKENINFKKFKTTGLPLREEQDKIWGGQTATGDDCFTPATVMDDGFPETFGDDCYTPQPFHEGSENFVDAISTGSSPVKATTPLQGSASTIRSRKRKQGTPEDAKDIEFKGMCSEVQSTSKEQRSYFTSKKEYLDLKKEIAYDKKEIVQKKKELMPPIVPTSVQPIQPLVPVDPSYDAAVKALVTLDLEVAQPELFYFAVELFFSTPHRQLFLALPSSARYGFIYRLYKKNGGTSSAD